MRQETKKCQNCKKNFEIYEEDFAFYEKIKVPPPTWCPDCRMIRRMAFWNERHFFRRKNMEGDETLSTYPEESYFKTIPKDEWWSDGFDAKKYGRDYDFSKPFLEQLKELASIAPFPDKSGFNMIGSEYSNTSNDLKNCYMCFNCSRCEDSLYAVFCADLKDSLDAVSVGGAESCYELRNSSKCNQVFFGAGLDNCRESLFLFNSSNCVNCFGSVNLRNKQYYIFNRPYTKEEYFEKLKELDTGSYKKLNEIKQRFEELKLAHPIKFARMQQCDAETTGDYVFFAKNVKDSFSIYEAENLRYCQSVVFGAKDCYDYTNWGVKVELVYEAVECGDDIRNVKFCYGSAGGCQNIEYCINMFGGEDCFGCVGLKKAKYCILNKEYSKEDYEKLRAKIIQHMNEAPYADHKERLYKYGDFFPIDMAPFAADETAIPDWKRLSEEEAKFFGLRWSGAKGSPHKITLKAEDIADHVKDAQDSITKEIIGCLKCKSAYRIVPREFDFYRRFNIALPRLCIECRYGERMQGRDLSRLYKSNCECAGAESDNKIYKNAAKHFHDSEHCPNTFQTAYSPERKEIVYCEKCYVSEVL